MKLAGAPALASARKLLNMPDLFNYWLTGETKSEITIASTTQFFDPRTMQWAHSLLDRLDLPSSLLCPLIAPGTRLGPMLDPPKIPVYATAGHDTAAAVAAVPALSNSNWCYISSGTWSLMGVELERPAIDDRCLALGFTNEVGVAAKIRLLKNIAGLWPVQECRRAWSLEGQSYTYEQLTALAAEAAPFSVILDPDAFAEPGDMPQRITGYCRNSGQEPPRSPAECVRALLEGLALRYRLVLERMDKLTGRKTDIIHVVGGGARNQLLNQFTANCTGVPVLAGPPEATAVGNILVQAMGAHELNGLDEIRRVVRRSFAPSRFEPREGRAWAQAYERFLRITQ
jgi:rhamnulokinase